MRSAWLWIGLGLVAIAIAIAWCFWYSIEQRNYRRELEQAQANLAGGRVHVARQQLLALKNRWSKSGQVIYDLGVCEEKLGHLNAALAVWSGIGADSPLFMKAAVARAHTLINKGRYALAEELLTATPHKPGPYLGHLRREMEMLLRMEGRVREARELIADEWGGAADPSEVLKRLHQIEVAYFPLEHVKEGLKRADPNDDRAWLAHANLDLWLGHFQEASRWLDACERRRPDDQAVWLARLSLALASRNLDDACRAMKHVRMAWFPPAEVLRHRAWLASFRGDNEVERQRLLELVAAEAGDTAAWARLAELAQQAGRRDDAESFRKKQAEMSALRDRYGMLVVRDERVQHAGELAQLAERLGHPLEARGWSLIRDGRADQPIRRDDRGDSDGARPSPMLYALMEDLALRAAPATTRAPSGRIMNTPAFADDAEKAGLRFVHENGHTKDPAFPPEAECGGVGLLDYDGDGWLDVYAVQGGRFPPVEAARAGGDGDRLFRNRGDGTFDDTTERAGIASFPKGYGNGVAVGDYDNDGRADLFVTRWRSYALYRNQGEGKFEDVTGRAGLAGDRDWPTSAAFADLDGDGDLDLYVCHYLIYDLARMPVGYYSEKPGVQGWTPRDFSSLPDHVFRNDSGRFVDVTTAAGIVDQNGRGLGIVAADFDDDNKIDLYVANDMSANYLFRNLGGFRFEESAEAAGAAAGADGRYKAGMGIACGDLDGDGLLDLAVTNFFGESTTFYRNLGKGLFVDQSAAIGLLSPSHPLLGFGIAFTDLNNDGWLDLLSTNGHVFDSRPRFPWKMPLQLMLGEPGGHLSDISDRAGQPFEPLHLGRGLAIGDLDNDGRMDAIVLNQNEPLVYLHNKTEAPGHFIRFSLEGTQSNRDGVGARVTIRCGGRSRVSERIGGGSYQSASDPRLHFGLGTVSEVESVEVRWPSGQVEHHPALPVDREYRLREGARPVEIRHNSHHP